MPAALVAVQVYTPLCLSATAPTVMMLVREPAWRTRAPSPVETGRPSIVQVSVIGVSPLLARQVSAASSPALRGASMPNGTMTGATGDRPG